MATDLARLVLQVDSTQVRGAVQDLDRLRQAGPGVERAATGVAAASGRMATAFATARSAALSLAGGVGVGIGLAGLTRAATSSIEAFRQLEEQTATMNAVIKATGGASQRTAEDIEGLAASIGDIRNVREAATQLLAFENIAGSSFDRILKIADDLSAVGFGDLISSTMLLAKAAQAPDEAFQRLRRSGISFTTQQERMIKALGESGHELAAQEIIFAEIESRVRGAGQAKDAGLGGAFEVLGDAVLRASERAGEAASDWLNLNNNIRLFAATIDRSAGFGAKLAAEIDDFVTSAREASPLLAKLLDAAARVNELDLTGARRGLEGLDIPNTASKANRLDLGISATAMSGEAPNTTTARRMLDPTRNESWTARVTPDPAYAEYLRQQKLAEAAAERSRRRASDMLADMKAQRAETELANDALRARLRGEDELARQFETQLAVRQQISAEARASNPEEAAALEEQIRLNQQLNRTYEESRQKAEEYASAITNNLGSAFDRYIESIGRAKDETLSLGDIIKDFARSALLDLASVTFKQGVTDPLKEGITSGLTNVISSLASGGGGFQPFGPTNAVFSEGGMVRGPGSSRSDSITARLSNGEFVVNAAATSRHRGLLESINSYASGGYVRRDDAPFLERPFEAPAGDTRGAFAEVTKAIAAHLDRLERDRPPPEMATQQIVVPPSLLDRLPRFDGLKAYDDGSGADAMLGVLRRTEQQFAQQQEQRMAAGQGGGAPVNVTINAPVDARGADNAAAARVEAEVRQMRADLPRDVIRVVQQAKSRRQI